MRITMQSIHYNILTNLNKITTDMNRINNQISSGKQMSTISDNPVNLVTALGLRSNLTQITSYQDNLTFGDKTITAAENALTQMKNLALRAKTLAIQQANASITPENRASAAEEVQHLFESAITLANTSVNGKYVFGGYRTTGYTQTEPTPFIQDARDGYFVNGGRMPDSTTTQLTGQVPSGAAADITTGDLLINGVDIRAAIGADIDLTNAGDNGFNMAGAWNTAQAINDQKVISQTGVSDTLISPYAGLTATGTVANSRVAFYLNGTLVDTNTVPANNLLAGDTASSVSQKIVNAIAAAFPTGTVTATQGTGANGGVANSIILRSNDGSPITITGLSATEKAISGLSNNKATEGVNAKLTTLYAGAAATAEGGNGGETMTQSINGVYFDVVVANNATQAQVASGTVAAINAIAGRTGVSARVGDGTNGGANNAVVLYNTLPGDESDILVGALTNINANTGLAAGTHTVGVANNTGTISLSSPNAFTITTSAASLPIPTDSILNRIGLGGGLKGFADNAGDGVLRYGSALAAGDLSVNGVAITTSADGISDVYQDISAAAKAAAINAKTLQTGVSATTLPPSITAVSAVTSGTETSKLIASPQNNGILAGRLAINGIAVGAIGPGAVTAGLNMGMADNTKQAINAVSASTGVTASLTTLYSSGVAATAGANSVSFSLNNVSIAYNTTGITASTAANDAVTAINNASDQTGVRAMLGTNSNGGITDSIVLYNALTGDESSITISGYNETGPGTSGLADSTTAADSTHNTGTVAFSSSAPFQISSPFNLSDDNILSELNLGGGEQSTGISGDTAADGILNYGSTPEYLGSGDLTINGVGILSANISVIAKDQSNTLINAINAKTAETGVKAGRDANGHLLLTAVDGRNLHIQTSAHGQNITGLSPGSGPQDLLYIGQVRLWGGDEFFLESATPTVGATIDYETGLAALGLTGGEGITGQHGDVASDGKIFVNTINYESGYVRYAGDRTNNFSVKVGPQSTIEVGKNGNAAVMETEIFSVLKDLMDAFRGQNYTTVNGAAKALDTNTPMNSGKTGLELENEIRNGSFTIAVSNHNTSPPTTLSSVTINIDTAKDSLSAIAKRINGVPGISASWSGDGYLQITSNDPDLYTFTLSDDTSNFLRATGSETDNAQVSNISKSIADLDDLMQNLTSQISDFGARSNRIIVQQQIYTNLALSTKENLSEKEDTDITKALLEIKSKETAYEAALAAAAKTMQLSLVDFLK